MIERLWQLLLELWGFLGASFDPVRDTLDIVLVTLGDLLAAAADPRHARGADPARADRADRRLDWRRSCSSW